MSFSGVSVSYSVTLILLHKTPLGYVAPYLRVTAECFKQTHHMDCTCLFVVQAFGSTLTHRSGVNLIDKSANNNQRFLYHTSTLQYKSITWPPEWHSSLKHCITVCKVSLQPWFESQEVSQLWPGDS
jgi:hypothetical protein